ncbi:MAG TPA: biopolymer transporter ExbD [Holophagaceae bacterium]|nr:biopolymer transporter ExbD [Holophagaceae bacterium]
MSFDVGGHKGGAKADINVTPLVDIVLVLLIIFIVITPAVNNSVKLPLAKHTPKVLKNPGDKYMTIIFAAKRDSDGRYLAPGLISVSETSGTSGEEKTFDLANPGSAQRLSDTINANVSQLQDKRVFVKADADLPYKVVDQLFQLARAAGAQQASIVTGEDKKPEGGSN